MAHIYRRYLALPSVMALMEELKAEGIFTKRQIMRDGSVRGGLPFVRGPLHHLLSNPIYIGKIQHKGQIHDGQHEAIVDQQLWDAVQAKRTGAIGTKRQRGNSQHASLLTGMIRDHADRPMSPSHAVKNRRRYRYYVSSAAAVVDGEAIKDAALRLPAAELEQAIASGIATLLADEQTIMALPQVDASAIQRRIRASASLAAKMEEGSKGEVRQQLAALGLTIIVHPDRIDASISRRQLVALLDGAKPDNADDGVRLPITVPVEPGRRGRNLKLVLGSQTVLPPKINPELIALLRKAEIIRERLFDQQDASMLRDRKAERTARLAFLAPDIVDAILTGRHPRSLTTRRLMQQPRIPLDWKQQRQELGF